MTGPKIVDEFTVHSPGRPLSTGGPAIPRHWFRVKVFETTEGIRAYRRSRRLDGPTDIAGGVIWSSDEIPPNRFLGTLVLAADFLPPAVVIHESFHLAVRAAKAQIGSQRVIISNGDQGVLNEELLAYLTDGIASGLLEHLAEHIAEVTP